MTSHKVLLPEELPENAQAGVMKKNRKSVYVLLKEFTQK
jgi:hypothetical protein